jgi:excisionase family DNA binding protein
VGVCRVQASGLAQPYSSASKILCQAVEQHKLMRKQNADTLLVMDDLIGVPEAARRLGVSTQWVLKLCRDGRIHGARRIGRDWLIPEGAKIDPPPPRRSRTIEIPRKGSKSKTR